MSRSIYLSEAFAYVNWAGVVELWFVSGHERQAYPTKIAAETAARIFEPVLAVEQGTNSLVYFRRFYSEAEQ